jgi:hypothetical protein
MVGPRRRPPTAGGVAARHSATTRITNPKVLDLAPTWRRYRGLSVLFDNPGTRVGTGVVPLENIPVDDPEQQRLYDNLADVVASIDTDDMRERYGFCPLPRYSYHVTVCDGPNERDIDRSTVPRRAAVAAVVDGLPNSLDQVSSLLAFLHQARVLPTVAAAPVTFVATGIAIWGHVLAAQLQPAGESAREALDRIARARAELSDDLQAHLGLQTQTWRPHVSLGYFPNRSAAESATATLTRWQQSLTAQPQPTITFSSAAVYGFTDMISFFRLGS